MTYAGRGCAVFPCVPGDKVPLTPNGFHGATANPDTVARWWAAEPHANIGLVPGYSALGHDGAPGTPARLDLDGPLGHATAVALDVPDDGPAVQTGRPDGGEHRWFWLPRTYAGAPLVIGNVKLGPGLDVRHGARLRDRAAKRASVRRRVRVAASWAPARASAGAVRAADGLQGWGRIGAA
jgi:hypothetical protein